jgi:hypothetical protein
MGEGFVRYRAWLARDSIARGFELRRVRTDPASRARQLHALLRGKRRLDAATRWEDSPMDKPKPEPEQIALFTSPTTVRDGITTFTNESAFLETVRVQLRKLSRRGQVVSGNDSKQVCETLGVRPGHRNWLGLVFNEPGWTHVGYTRATAPESHGRQIKTWKWGGQ